MILQRLQSLSQKIPGPIYLWLAVLIFGASSAITRKLTEIGAQNFTGGHNPISLCNVLFVGNLCALIVLLLIYQQQWRWLTLKQISRRQWLALSIVAVLSGALAPALIFQALTLTGVNNVVLIGRLEPPLTLTLSVWFLRERVNRWEILGAIAAFIGVALTILLQPVSPAHMDMGPIHMGRGEGLAAIAAIALALSTILGKAQLSQVPLGIYSVFRTAIGTIVFFIFALVLYGPDHFAEAFSPFLWQWMLLYGALIVVVGQSFWVTGLRVSTVSTVSIVGSFTPIAGILSAYLILGEAPLRAQYIGGAVILLGILLGQLGTGQKAQASATLTKVTVLETGQTLESRVGFKGI
ncbi:DMT family transporter [Leptolyngbya sp. 'hensonii']|uniref:DMT family transporter n=1 Tax=Leptolyngbya sp. 'hensonii' TaxID=1922337 RepID=UPI000A77E5B6|nr:DMT family transporter [Leptolyngbya sp. 'hensonii']